MRQITQFNSNILLAQITLSHSTVTQTDCFEHYNFTDKKKQNKVNFSIVQRSFQTSSTLVSCDTILSPFSRTPCVKKRQQVQHVQRLTVPRRHLSVADQASRRVAPGQTCRVVRCPSQFDTVFFFASMFRDIFHRRIDGQLESFRRVSTF